MLILHIALGIPCCRYTSMIPEERLILFHRLFSNNLFTLSIGFFSYYALYPNPVHYAHLNNNRPLKKSHEICAPCVCYVSACMFAFFYFFSFNVCCIHLRRKGYIIVSLVVNPLILLEINEFYLVVMVFLFVSFVITNELGNQLNTHYNFSFF